MTTRYEKCPDSPVIIDSHSFGFFSHFTLLAPARLFSISPPIQQ
jgi:hypothetical protein